MNENQVLFACGKVTGATEVVAKKVKAGDKTPSMDTLIAACKQLEKACGN